MLNKIVPVFLCLALFSGCEEEISLEFSSESITETSAPLCETAACPEITINYPEYLADNSISEAINSEVKNYVISSLNLGEDETPTAETITEAIEQFAIAYQEDKALYADMSADYSAEINIKEGLRTDELVSMEMNQYKYTGGAHGNGSTKFVNFDFEKGQVIPKEALFKNVADFEKLAEKHFRKKYNIAETESINAPGFWFENDEFYLPESIGFVEDNLIFIYNQYDIASFAEGPIEITIPIEEVKAYVNYQL